MKYYESIEILWIKRINFSISKYSQTQNFGFNNTNSQREEFKFKFQGNQAYNLKQ